MDSNTNYAKQGKGPVGALKKCVPIEPAFTRQIGTGGGACIDEMQPAGAARVKAVGHPPARTVKRGPGSK